MHKAALEHYGLRRIADVRIDGNEFLIDVTDPATIELTGCIYAFVIDSEIVRVGSSAGALSKRIRAWRRDVSKSLSGAKSATPHDEAERWRLALGDDADGAVYARRGTVVSTPVGEFTAHLDEERVLIARYRPRLNRSSR